MAHPMRRPMADKAGLRGTGDVSGAGNDIAFEQRTILFGGLRDPMSGPSVDFPGLEAGESRHGKQDIPFEEIRRATPEERQSISLVSGWGHHKVQLQ